MCFFDQKRNLKSKLTKPVTQCALPKSKNQIFDDQKIQKAYKNPRLSSKKLFLSDLVIKQVKVLVLMTMLWLFSANWCLKKMGSELTSRWSNTPWCIFDPLSSFWFHWDTLSHWHIISRSYWLRWWSSWVWSVEQSLFVWAASFFYAHPL